VPGSQRNETSSTAGWEPYRLVRCSTVIMRISLPAPPGRPLRPAVDAGTTSVYGKVSTLVAVGAAAHLPSMGG
jgi:hypothetical protein